MADKPEKKGGKEPEKVEEPFELDKEQVRLEEMRARLSPDDLAYLRGVTESAEALRSAFTAPDEVKRQDIFKQYEHVTGTIAREQARIAAIADPRQREAELARHRQKAEALKRRAEALEAEAQTYKAPEVYNAIRQIRETALKKFKDLATDNWSELVGYFLDALHDKDVPKAEAVFRKLTNDGNENELLNWMGYPSTIQGLHDFINEVLIGRKQKRDPQGKRIYDEFGNPKFDKIDHLPNDPKLHPAGMHEQEALALESDISYAAEKIGHWEVARVVKRDITGRFVQMSEQEHAHECTIEIGNTRDPRAVARGLNRLAYGGEFFDVSRIGDYRRGALGRDFTPSTLGFSILATYGKFIQTRWDTEVNLNLKIKLAQWLERDPEKHKSMLREIGVPEGLIEKIEKAKTVEQVRTDVGAVVENITRMREKAGIAPK